MGRGAATDSLPVPAPGGFGLQRAQQIFVARGFGVGGCFVKRLAAGQSVRQANRLPAGVGLAQHVDGGVGAQMALTAFLLRQFQHPFVHADAHARAQGDGNGVRGTAVHAGYAFAMPQQQGGIIDAVPDVHDFHTHDRALERLHRHEQQIVRQGAGQLFAAEHEGQRHGFHGADQQRQKGSLFRGTQNDERRLGVRVQSQTVYLHFYHDAPACCPRRLCFLASVRRTRTMRPVMSPSADGRPTCTSAP